MRLAVCLLMMTLSSLIAAEQLKKPCVKITRKRAKNIALKNLSEDLSEERNPPPLEEMIVIVGKQLYNYEKYLKAQFPSLYPKDDPAVAQNKIYMEINKKHLGNGTFWIAWARLRKVQIAPSPNYYYYIDSCTGVVLMESAGDGTQLKLR